LTFTDEDNGSREKVTIANFGSLAEENLDVLCEMGILLNLSIEASSKGDGEPKTQAQPSSERAAGLPIPPGATPEIVARGFHIFRGEEGGGTC
jgi:hypothetical protein